MIVVTGGAGFIGSAMVRRLNEKGISDILIVDGLRTSVKWKNLVGKRFLDYFHKDQFIPLLLGEKFPKMDAIIHMGANSSTTETDADHLMENNYRYTQTLAQWSIRKNVRFIYASSGATYGDGSQGFSDDPETTLKLVPLNPYGYSKQIFDLWLLQNRLENKVVGIKFFNVFGPNEYHKGDMKSLVYKAYHQIQETGKIQLFKSYKPEYNDGEQVRDFIYVKDCIKVIEWFLDSPKINGIFNLGTGKVRTWNDLAGAVFSSLKKKPKIEYIEMPKELRDAYQYRTQAQIEHLRRAGYNIPFQSLEDSVKDYVENYLHPTLRYL
ncbi:MAG: ADP-glyceromanno-heptose 6-epimerase [Chlamydiae bacterium]|nr:ADP-glyceromanno-heptose 6-epimerase [Chlamydiota bacterium]